VFIDFYLVRHGKHDGTHLTEEGRAQVEASARKNLSSIRCCDLIFSSGMPRAIETAEVAYEAIVGSGTAMSVTPIRKDTGFGYEFAEADGAKQLWPWEECQKQVAAAEKAGERVTVAWMIQNWIPTRTVRQVLLCTMRHWAERLTASIDEAVRGRVCILVGSHASASFAAPFPTEITGNLENGGIIRYTWMAGVDTGLVAKLQFCEHLSAQ
jgi:broad specificity phosphatase PhoE